ERPDSGIVNGKFELTRQRAEHHDASRGRIGVLDQIVADFSHRAHETPDDPGRKPGGERRLVCFYPKQLPTVRLGSACRLAPEEAQSASLGAKPLVDAVGSRPEEAGAPVEPKPRC